MVDLYDAWPPPCRLALTARLGDAPSLPGENEGGKRRPRETPAARITHVFRVGVKEARRQTTTPRLSFVHTHVRSRF